MSFFEKRARQGQRFGAVLLVLLLLLVVYVSMSRRTVELPAEHMHALTESVPEEQLQGALLEARREGENYTVDLTQDLPDGRRVTYKYTITPDLTVRQQGMTIGTVGPNPFLVLSMVLLACAFLGYAIYNFSRKLITPKCPDCGTMQNREELTLFGGGVDTKGDVLPAIILTTWRCPDCGHVKNRVSQAGEHRAGNIKTPSLVRPDHEDTADRLRDAYLESRTMTYEQWKKLLKGFKEQYEEKHS